MLGQHPQMYGLPETHLLCHETVGTRAARVARSAHLSMEHGLLRAVAELYFGEQTESTVRRARQWLKVRADFPTEVLFRTLADRAFPRLLVEKIPSTVNSIRCLRRIQRKFPGARFIHLLRHPRGHGESVMKAIAERESRTGPLPPTNWLMRIASYRPHGANADSQDGAEVLDPQHWWYARNATIREFLGSVSRTRQLQVRGEDLLADPDTHLQAIASWMGLRTDPQAIDMMKHPEHSPYAFIGPRGARFGNDRIFLQAPALRSGPAKPQDLDQPLSWRDDGQGFLPEVKAMAREFGYS